jgi:hypothetical protein
MRSSEKEKLLNELIAEGDYQQFREELLASTAKEFRRAHRKSSGKLWLALAACVALTAVLSMQFFSPKQKQTVASVSTPSQAPLLNPKFAPVEIVTSKPIPDSDVIRTVPSQALIVRTRITLPEISDVQLLALFKGQGAGFVEGEGGRRFVVMNPKTMAPARIERQRNIQ